MGLDYVEMILRVEDTFSISIPDKDCETLTTVGALYRYVLDKVASTHPKACLTSFTFYRVRRALMETFGLPRSQIRPDTPLENVIPTENRKIHWSQFSASLGFSLPRLQWPSGFLLDLSLLSHGLMIVSFLFLTHLITDKPYPVATKVLFGIGLILICIAWKACDFLLRPRRWAFPKDCPDVGALAKWILGMNFKKISALQRKWTDADIWESLRVVIAEELGLKIEDIVPEARFYEDFNAG